jgi:hypothetical protein
VRGAKSELLEGLIWGGEGRRSEFNGGLGSPAFGGWRRWCSWVWGWGIGKQTKGTGCGAICNAQARARSRAGALRRARHGGVAVAAARRFRAAWRREGAPARGGGGSRSLWRRHVKRRRSWIWPGAIQRGGGRRGAVGGAGSRGAGRKEKGGLFAISENSKDQNVKQG